MSGSVGEARRLWAKILYLEGKKIKITLNIPDDLISAVIRILKERRFPDDDGITDVIVMREENLTVDQFVKADHLVDGIENAIKKQRAKKRQQP